MRSSHIDPLEQARTIVCTSIAANLVAGPARRRVRTPAWIHVALGIWIGLTLCAIGWLLTL